MKEQIQKAISYLNDKKVPYAIEQVSGKFIKVNISIKNHRAYANGKLISKYMACFLESLGMAKYSL